MLRCSEKAAKGGQTACALPRLLVSTYLIQRNAAVHYPRMKVLTATFIYAFRLVQYAWRHPELTSLPTDGRLLVRFCGDLQDFAIEARPFLTYGYQFIRCLGLPMAQVYAIIIFSFPIRDSWHGD